MREDREKRKERGGRREEGRAEEEGGERDRQWQVLHMYTRINSCIQWSPSIVDTLGTW